MPRVEMLCGVDFAVEAVGSHLDIYGGRPLFEMGAMEQLQLDFKKPLKRTTSWSNWDDWV